MRKTFPLLVALLAGCSRCQPLPVPEPQQVAVASSSNATTATGGGDTSTSTTGDSLPTCATACANQRDLGCELGLDTPEGHPCEEVCENLEAGPIASIRWDVGCLSEAASCEECDD